MTSVTQDEIPDEPQSCQQVAELYDISITQVRFLAVSRGLGRDNGEGELVFGAADVASMRPRGPGRPWAERDTP